VGKRQLEGRSAGALRFPVEVALRTRDHKRGRSPRSHKHCNIAWGALIPLPLWVVLEYLELMIRPQGSVVSQT
jgi:hypothetical protein